MSKTILYSTYCKSGGDLVLSDVLVDENCRETLRVWTQDVWNKYRQQQIEKKDDSLFDSSYNLQFDMPPAGAAIFRDNNDVYHVVISHAKLDRIDIFIAVEIFNALGGIGTKYEFDRSNS